MRFPSLRETSNYAYCMMTLIRNIIMVTLKNASLCLFSIDISIEDVWVLFLGKCNNRRLGDLVKFIRKKKFLIKKLKEEKIVHKVQKDI